MLPLQGRVLPVRSGGLWTALARPEADAVCCPEATAAIDRGCAFGGPLGGFARKRWRNSRFRGYRAADPADHLQGPACLSGLLTLAIGRGRSARNYFPNPIVDKAIKVRVINHDPDLLILGKPGPYLMEQLLSAGGAPGVGAADYTVYVV